MKVKLEIGLEQANVIHSALLDRLRVVRFNAKTVSGTPDERLDALRELNLVEQTFRVLDLEIPEPPKEVDLT